jgi:hypothetical protein
MGVAVDAFGSEVDVGPAFQTVKTVVAVYREASTGLEEVACNVQFSSGRIESRAVWNTDGASAYYVMGAAYQSVPMGVLRLNFNPAHIPDNDIPEGATAVSLANVDPLIQPAHSATVDASDPDLSCAPPYGYSAWFTVSESAGQQLSMTSAGSDYNTVMGVFKRDPGGGLTEVACNDNDLPNITSRVSWQSDGGEYLVVVGAFGSFGGGVLRLDLQSAP